MIMEENKMISSNYKINVVSGDAEATILISAPSYREAIVAAAQKINNNQVDWEGSPDVDWEFISIVNLEPAYY